MANHLIPKDDRAFFVEFSRVLEQNGFMKYHMPNANIAGMFVRPEKKKNGKEHVIAITFLVASERSVTVKIDPKEFAKNPKEYIELTLHGINEAVKQARYQLDAQLYVPPQKTLSKAIVQRVH